MHEKPRHPIVALLEQDERTVAWLARKIRYSYIHTWQVLNGQVPASSRFQERCSEVLGKPANALFLDLEATLLAS